MESGGDRYEQVKNLFLSASALDPERRAAFLDEQASGDPTLREEVESLLLHHDDADAALDDPLLGPSARYLISEALRAAQQQRPPEQIGPYRIVRTIALGGMGAIYEGRLPHSERRFAIKTILPGTVSAKRLQRFQLEMELLARLSHPGIARILGSGTFDEGRGPRPYFAMEYMDGVSLTDHARECQLGLPQRLSLFAAVCDAVHYAHQKGVVHRDLKPENILVAKQPAETTADRSGEVKVLDFGVARALDSSVHLTTVYTQTDQLVGTLAYMSPEQLIGDRRDVDTLCDVYALGVVLYELLAGRPPYDLEGLSLPSAIHRITSSAPARVRAVALGLPADVEAIVSKAMARDRGERYSSAAELAKDVRRYLGHQPTEARPSTTWFQLNLLLRRNRALVGGFGAALLALVVGLVLTTHFALQSMANAVSAAEREQDARRLAYATAITAASLNLETGNPTAAAAQLRLAPAELRNWEFRHLRSRIVVLLAELTTGDGAGRSDRCAFQPDGTPVLAQVRANEVHLIDLRSEEVIDVFAAGHDPRLPTLAPNGLRVGAISMDGPELLVWDTLTGELLLRLPVPHGAPVDMHFDRRGSSLALAFSDGLMVVDTDSGQVAERLPFGEGVLRVALDQSGARLAVATQAGLSLLDASSGERLAWWPLPGNEVLSALAFSPDGRILAFGTPFWGREVRRFDTTTFEELPRLRGLSSGVGAIAWFANGAQLAGADDSTLVVWDTGTGEAVHRVAAAPLREPVSMVPSVDGSLVALAGEHAAALLEIHPEPSRVLRHASFVYHVSFSPDGTMIASVTGDHEMRWWDADTGDSLLVLPLVPRGQGLGFSADGSRLWTSAAIWDTASGRRLAEPVIDADCYLRSARGGAKLAPWAYGGEDRATSPRGTLELEGTEAGEVVVRDLRTNTEVKRLSGHAGRVHAVAVGPEDALAASGGADRSVRVWSLALGRCLAVLQGHTSDVFTLVFSPDGSRFASGGNDGKIRLWDTTSFEQVGELHGHESYVHSLAFSPDGTQLASASGDGTVRIWDSVPGLERRARAAAREQQRERMRPRVDALLTECGDVGRVAQRLREDASLGEDERRAALRVLLEASRDRPPLADAPYLPADGVVARYDAGRADADTSPADPCTPRGGSWSRMDADAGIATAAIRDDRTWGAWRVDDASGVTTGAIYRRVLSDCQVAAARLRGWILRVRLRLAQSEGEPSVVFFFDQGDMRWTWRLRLDAAGDLVLVTDQTPTSLEKKLTTGSSGTREYHLLEAVFDPIRRRTTLSIDGRIVDEGYPGVAKSLARATFGQVSAYAGSHEEVGFGADSEPGQGEACFNLVEFAIGVGEPSHAPWTASGSDHE